MHAINILQPSQQQQQQQPSQQEHLEANLRQLHGQEQVGPQAQETTMTVLDPLEPMEASQQLLGQPDGNQMGLLAHQQSHLGQQQQQMLLQHHQMGQPQQLADSSQSENTLHQASSNLLSAGNRPAQKRQRSNRPTFSRQRAQQDGIIHPLHEGGGPIVRWLKEKYEIADGESLPRSTVYNHYLAYCRYLNISSVNAASFGKLIRSVFVGLKTRRLGTRGHSKYHYFGVRATASSQDEHQQLTLLGGDNSGQEAGCSRADQLASSQLMNSENSNQNTENGSESAESSSMGQTPNNETMDRLSSGGGGSPVKRHRPAGHQSQMYSELHSLDQQHQTASVDPQQVDCANNIFYYTDNNHPQQHNNSGAPATNGYPHQPSGKEARDHQQMISNEQQNLYDLAEFKNHLGANWATLVDEHWPPASQPGQPPEMIEGHNSSELEFFETKYKLYYKRMVELLSELKFSEIKQLWQEFWHPSECLSGADTRQAWSMLHQMASHHQENGPNQIMQHHPVDYQQQSQSAFHQLYLLTSQASVVERIDQIDYNLYSAIQTFLLPDMLSPIPRLLVQQISLFAQNIDLWLKAAVEEYPAHFVVAKTKSARAFGYALRRYISLNRLSTASRAIWEKRSTLARMSIDLSRVDSRDIEHQVSLMSSSNSLFATNNHQNNNSSLFSNSITKTPTVATETTNNTQPVLLAMASAVPNSNNEQTANENNLAPDIMSNHHHHHQHNTHHQHHLNSHNHLNTNNSSNHNGPYQMCAMQPAQLIQNFLHLLEDPYPANSWPDWCRNLVESRVSGTSIEEARNFVFLWNFYISLIMKELTLRSAPSYGSFTLIKLLFDEYIFYLVITRLAQAHNKTPAELMSF